MVVQQTSLAAFNDIKKELGEKQRVLLALFKSQGILYDQKAAELLDWPINSLTPRRLELEQKGLVEKFGCTTSNFSGKTVNQYRVIENER